ncbi:unnamed protein product, partial [Gulo gulo]
GPCSPAASQKRCGQPAWVRRGEPGGWALRGEGCTGGHLTSGQVSP